MSTISQRGFRRMGSYNWIGGVASGLAYKLGIKTWIIRLLWFVSVWYYGAGFIIYLLLWIFVPEWDKDPEDYNNISG